MENVIYFLRSESGKIKIGTTRDIRSRLGAYRTNAFEKIVLVGYVPGGVAIERLLHGEFAECRLSGEWFEPTHKLILKIDDLISEFGSTDIPIKRKKPDYCTLQASSWASSAIEIIALDRNITVIAARRAFANECNLADGTLFNLSRNRLVAITAADMESIRVGYLSCMENEIAKMKIDIAYAKELEFSD